MDVNQLIDGNDIVEEMRVFTQARGFVFIRSESDDVEISTNIERELVFAAEICQLS